MALLRNTEKKAKTNAQKTEMRVKNRERARERRGERYTHKDRREEEFKKSKRVSPNLIETWLMLNCGSDKDVKVEEQLET